MEWLSYVSVPAPLAATDVHQHVGVAINRAGQNFPYELPTRFPTSTSRNGRDWSAEFVAITEALRALPFRRVMLDGEAVSHCLDGLPDFHKLMSRDGQATACLYAFDLHLA